MLNNLIISYDLHAPVQNYDAVIDAIKELGSWASVHGSVWYVKSSLSEVQAREKIWKVMDSDDSLIIFNATTNSCAWQNLSEAVANFISNNWSNK